MVLAMIRATRSMRFLAYLLWSMMMRLDTVISLALTGHVSDMTHKRSEGPPTCGGPGEEIR